MLYPHIKIRRGVPYVGKIPVNRLWFWKKSGAAVETIIRRYADRLSEDQVRIALLFAKNHPHDVDTPTISS